MEKRDLYSQMLGGRAKFWTGDLDVEQEALNQVRNTTTIPILGGHVAVMADCHAGKGSTVGTVIPTRSAIIPAAIGSDVGCGMVSVQTSLKASDMPDGLYDLRMEIEKSIPVGFNQHTRTMKLGGLGLEGMRIQRERDALLNKSRDLRIMRHIGRFDEKRVEMQLGTLGGGNHMIEVCLDEDENVWTLIHSGSRNVGKTVGDIGAEVAKEEIAKQYISLVDKDLSWLAEGTPLFDEYIEAMLWCQAYAKLNRDIMMLLMLNAMRKLLPEFTLVNEAINCHHNFAQRETHFGESMWITRKGAVSAQKGQWGIIPGSMGAKSFIVCGKGHEAAYCSCSHGAGRTMSRGAAKRKFTVKDLQEQTEGIECRKDFGVIDEIPAAYKPIQSVIDAQSDLIEVKAVLRQILNIKG
jgi:tRNA-splicing ligase RtcB